MDLVHQLKSKIRMSIKLYYQLCILILYVVKNETLFITLHSQSSITEKKLF